MVVLVRTFLLIVGIWLLVNVLFVVVVLPSRRPAPTRRAGIPSPVTINTTAGRSDDHDPPLLQRAMRPVAVRVLFIVLILPVLRAWNAVRRHFRGHDD